MYGLLRVYTMGFLAYGVLITNLVGPLSELNRCARISDADTRWPTRFHKETLRDRRDHISLPRSEQTDP